MKPIPTDRFASLHEALQLFGWRSEGTASGKRTVWDDKGRELGRLHADEVWDLLRERGLVA